MTPEGWTTVADLVATVRRRWDRGVYLRAHAAGVDLEPVSLPIRGPKGADLADRFDAVRIWVDHFERDNGSGSSRPRFDLDYRNRRTRTVGDNPLPVRAHVPTFARLCGVLGTGGDVSRLDRVLALTTAAPAFGDDERAALVAWVQDHPMVAIDHHGRWVDLLAVVGWVISHGHDRATLDLRHLDVPGVDTKFVERHRKIVSRLLEQVVPEGEIDRTASSFAGRFGFRARSSHVRFRLLAPVPELPEVITEVELRVDELARLPLSFSTAFIVENRATYLAFPPLADSIAIFGEGFGVTVLEGIPWLADRRLVYWGDIDTHGFAILDRLRQRVPGVRSVLMDRQTLIDHLDHVVVEARPTAAPLTTLTPAEQAVYDDLVEDRFGTAVRLEQERVRFSAVRRALEPWTGPAGRPRR